MPQFSTSDLARAARVSELLLSPLSHGSVDGWRHAVNAELRALTGADSAGFLLPCADAAPMYCAELPPEVLAPYPDLLPPPLGDGTPAWRRLVSLGVGTVGDVYREHVAAYLGSPYYNEFAAPGGGAETLAVAVPLSSEPIDGPHGAATVHLWHATVGPRTFGDRERALLRLIFPSFKAGIAAWLRFHDHHATLLRTIDQLGQAVLATDPVGRTLHMTPALAALIAEDAGGVHLQAALTAFAHQARPASLAGVRAHATIRTAGGRYSLLACRHPGEGTGDAMTLISVTRECARRRSPSELHARFGLTRAEIRVARLFADGVRTSEVAAALGISPHTVKRHGERVFRKLGVQSRAAVGPALDG